MKKIRIITKLLAMYAKLLPRWLVFILGQIQVSLLVKLSKIGENFKNFRKIFVVEANKTAIAKIFSKRVISLERTFNCE